MTTILADARRGHRGLFAFAVAMAALAPVLAVLAVVDHRVLLGAPVWLKPVKFAVSFVAYSGTLAWMLSRLPRRTLPRTGWTIVVASTVEMAIITGQAARGVRSHFNGDSAFDAALFSVMGATIVVLWLATLVVALRFLRERGVDRVTATAVRLGLVVALVGLLEGFVMIAVNGHTVGLPDGGPGLPLVGWSTVGGDLRIAHFVGMHALQGLPLLAAALTAVRGLTDDVRVRVLHVVAAAWTGLVVLLTWQALRAQPLLAPDTAALAALGALVVGTVAGLAVAARRTAGPAVAGF